MDYKPIKTKEDLDRFVLSKIIPPKPGILQNLKDRLSKKDKV